MKENAKYGMKSFISYCEQRGAETKNWLYLCNEFAQDPFVFETFLFLYDCGVKDGSLREQLDIQELNLFSRMGNWLTGNQQAPQQPAAQQPVSTGGAGANNFAIKQQFAGLVKAFRQDYLDQSGINLRKDVLQDPSRAKLASNALQKIVGLGNQLKQSGDDRTGLIAKMEKLKQQADQSQRIQQANQQPPAAGAGGTVPPKPPAAPPGAAPQPQPNNNDNTMVNQEKQQAIISSKVISDTLNKIINQRQIKAWFQGEKAPILQNLVNAWSAFKNEVKNGMQKDPRYPPPYKPTSPISNMSQTQVG